MRARNVQTFPLFLLLSLVSLGKSFVNVPVSSNRAVERPPSFSVRSALTVPISELEKDLSAEERSITAVVRKCGPSVAFVTSIWSNEEEEQEYSGWRLRRRRRQQQQQQQDPTTPKKNDTQPRGRSLGSGSGFVVDPEGYVVTNFHVIELAYRIQSMSNMYQELLTNLTKQSSSSSSNNNEREEGLSLGSILAPLLANATSRIFPKLPFSDRQTLPQVYVRINSATQYQPCRIVDVKPELDVAVLKIVPGPNNITTSSPSSWAPVSFGSSSDLLVGQGVVAIGNPFGLDNTVTKGVVSALNRDLQITAPSPLPRNSITASTANVIRNCIQTDAAINPGNSGGPLLNTQGQVVGVNTAIVTTSGSNAGIGFAIPSDSIAPVVQSMIRDDRRRRQQDELASMMRLGFLGVSILRRSSAKDVPDDKTETVTSALRKDIIFGRPLNWVTQVQPGSPAQEAGIRPLVVVSSEAQVLWGDAIVAIGGRQVATFDELQSELDRRVAGELVAITLENVTGDRRVVYVTLRKE